MQLTDNSRIATQGVVVSFRLEDDDTLLWQAPMTVLPTKDDEVGELVDGEVAVWYKVEKVKFEVANVMLTPLPTLEDPVPTPYPAKYAKVGVCVVVTEP